MGLDCLVLMTRGFQSLPPEVQAAAIRKALGNISKETDFIVFDPDADKESYEDEGKTLRVPLKNADKKVYAKLDDFGSPEALSENAGMKVDTQYALTFMLAEEY